MSKKTPSRSFPQCAGREHGERTDGHAAMEKVVALLNPAVPGASFRRPSQGWLGLLKVPKPAYPLGPRFARPRQGLAGGCAPSAPPTATARHEPGTRRVGEAPCQRGGARAEWHAKARSAGLTLSDLVRRSVGRVRTWTAAHAEVARIDSDLNQIARWANSHKGAVEVIGHLIAIERALAVLAPAGCPDTDAR